MFVAILMQNAAGNMKHKIIDLHHTQHFRIIPSVYPPINFFEGLVDPDEMEALFEIESLTNERLRETVGDIFQVAAEDRITGPGSSVIMAAFTHIHFPSRFTNGSYGVYYAGLTLETAIRETVFHREHFLNHTQEAACDITMRVYEGKINKPLHDIRAKPYHACYNPNDYQAAQTLGQHFKSIQSWGLYYHSVRHIGEQCVALLRPPATTIPVQSKHLQYHWNGHKITHVSEITPIKTF